MKPFPHLTIECFNPANLEHAIFNAAKIKKQQKIDHDTAITEGQRPRPMIPLTGERMANHPYGIFGYHHEEGDLVAYGGITYEFPEDRTIEIGALITLDKYRGNGHIDEILNRIYQEAKRRYVGWKAIVFANENTAKKFRNQPWFEESDPDHAPLGARELCRTECEEYNLVCAIGKKCCDTIFIANVDDLGRIAND